MESLTVLRRAVDEITRIVDGLDESDLAKQTPCTEWKVRDLLNHITGGATMFAVSAEQGSVPDDVMAAMGGDSLGDDFKGAWKAASARALSAFDDPAVMERNLTLPFGEMPGAMALAVAAADVSTHLCDLSKTTGEPVKDDELLDAALTLGQQVIQPGFRMPGVFDAERPCSDDAPMVDRILAFAGREI